MFWVKDGALLTPPLDDHILASITRALVIEVMGAAERPCPLEELRAADEVFLASTVREVQPVSAIDEQAFDAPGPVSQRTAAARRRADRGRARLSRRLGDRSIVRVLTVIGNRPQFIKAAAVSPGLRAAAEEVLIHTGQHFDDELSAVFFRELGLPAPDRSLEHRPRLEHLADVAHAGSARVGRGRGGA